MNEKVDPLKIAENPELLTGLRLGEIKSSAAGFKAVLVSAKQVFAEAGVRRGLTALGQLNQKGGFDCPSCAWPDPDDERSGLGEYCENGAKAVADEATSKTLRADFFASHSVEELGSLTDFEIGRMGRIGQPMFLPQGASHYQQISWDDAFSRIAANLNQLSSPDEAVFYTSGRTSNEAAFLYQLFVRAYGTNNLPDCSNMCHESSGVALGEALGIGKGSVKLQDFYEAEVIIILGQNPGTNHPRMLSALQKAKRNGAVIISINPLPETGLMAFSNPQQVKGLLGVSSALTDIFLQVKINGDMPLLQAIEKTLFDEELLNPGTIIDLEFVHENTEGFEAFKSHITNLDFADLVKKSGVREELILDVASVLKRKKKIIACWAMGLTQHVNAVNTIREIVNLLLLKGSIGKPGAGTCPVRGHSNVQGDRTMGIYEKPGQSFLDALQSAYHFSPPQNPGYDVVESIRAMHDGRAKIFFALGGNFLSATPDTRYTAEALSNCQLTVHVSTKLNRSHLVHGHEAIILPCLARSDRDLVDGVEQFVSCENSMGVVQASRGNLKPVSVDLLSEPVIVARLALSTIGGRKALDWERIGKNYDLIRDEISRVIPGFENYNERVRIPGGFYLPNCNREGRFDTVSGKASFHNSTFITPPIGPGELIMMTIRSHDQFNTTIYGLDDRYRGIFNERRVILMNAADIDNLGFKDGDLVDLTNNHGGIERIARKFIIVQYSIPLGCTATYFPETNVLVPISSVAEKSNTPTSKWIIIKLQKHG